MGFGSVDLLDRYDCYAAAYVIAEENSTVDGIQAGSIMQNAGFNFIQTPALSLIRFDHDRVHGLVLFPSLPSPDRHVSTPRRCHAKADVAKTEGI